jgi:hypothetical protein
VPSKRDEVVFIQLRNYFLRFIALCEDVSIESPTSQESMYIVSCDIWYLHPQFTNTKTAFNNINSSRLLSICCYSSYETIWLQNEVEECRHSYLQPFGALQLFYTISYACPLRGIIYPVLAIFLFKSLPKESREAFLAIQLCDRGDELIGHNRYSTFL